MAYYDTEELWFPERDHMGVPWENSEGYEKHNPVRYVHNWKTPMLVIHGALDFRVVETQGLATFNALHSLMTDDQIRRLRGVDIGGADQTAEASEAAEAAEPVAEAVAVAGGTIHSLALEADGRVLEPDSPSQAAPVQQAAQVVPAVRARKIAIDRWTVGDPEMAHELVGHEVRHVT